MRVDDNRCIDHFTCLVVVIEGLAYDVDVLCERLACALSKHKVAQQGQTAYERAATQRSHRMPRECGRLVDINISLHRPVQRTIHIESHG
jgi:hypothetical protein